MLSPLQSMGRFSFFELPVWRKNQVNSVKNQLIKSYIQFCSSFYLGSFSIKNIEGQACESNLKLVEFRLQMYILWVHDALFWL
jgi:hypothetical protein